MRIRSLEDLKQLKEEGLRSLFPGRTQIAVSMATCGRASGATEVFEAIKDEVNKRSLDFVLKSTGCLGFCVKEPLVSIMKTGWPRIIYTEVNPEKSREIVAALAYDRVLPRYALCRIEEEIDLVENTVFRYPVETLPEGIEKIPKYGEVPFFSRQERRVLRNCGLIDPEKIEEYVARGGYSTLFTALTKLKPDEIIEEVTKSGLRGRGGAGFPTGRKWRLCRQAEGNPKYIICNADEGDPGAYMDRSILEGDPHSVIEGMVIGAYAIGAAEGYIYCRAEKPLAIERLATALKQAEEKGFLGKDILGSGFNFTVHLKRGAGAFVCGEETALIASIEGLAGEPRQRPPFPAQSGLWGKPTNINNVKTWANIPLIIARGASWFCELGTADGKGTVVFSLVGKVKNTGLVEVPMGTKLRTLVFDIGGGIPAEKRFKAVQTGGPSGGCLPPSQLDLPVEYDSLTRAGSIMGSGGMVVMDEDTCMVDVARYFLTFTRDESCGKCTPCREGTRRMLEILTDITEGRGREEDIRLLEDMAASIVDSSLCALGGTAPNPVLTTLRYFRNEYEEHIKYKRCPAGVCKKIIFTACKHQCPLHTDVPAFIAHIARKEYREAFEIIRTPNPLPICCGYICHHPCEDHCRTVSTGGESISIKGLKRFVGDYMTKDGYKPLPKPKVPTMEKVAIVGSGPAGLAAAFDLTRLGYQPTIFEAAPAVGGNLAMVIPEFRLPRLIMQLEIECIKQAGVEILTNTPVGAGLTFDDLFVQGYKAILVATGAHKSLKLGLPGENIPGVMHAYDFLRRIKQGDKIALGERVGLIGGGNAAIDAARTALRAGAKQVSIIYRRTREEMPAIRREIEAGVEEGVTIMELAAPNRLITENGRLTGLECLRMELGEYDDSGRRKPVPVSRSEFIIPLDSVIVAIGEEPDLSFLPSDHGLEISKRNTIATDPETMTTKRRRIFAAGDVVTGPSTIADAMASGKLAASSIHKFLRGQPVVREYSVTPPVPYVEPVVQSVEDVAPQRFPMPCAPVVERLHNFGVVELGFNEETAVKEAKRCLRCDLAVAREEAVLEGAKHG